MAACTADGGEAQPEELVGACLYESPFSGGAECREYSGASWGEADAIDACAQLSGTDDMGNRCPVTYTLGTCVLDDQADRMTTIFIYGEDAGDCQAQQTGCELFGGGRWEPAPLCIEPAPTPGGGSVFIQPTLECREPLAGEPAGQGEDGLVCTWQSIAGATEEGREFADYGSCDIVRSQRPYYPAPPAAEPAVADERMQNPEYVAELEWVTSQVKASACVCCHSTETTPNGPSNWFLEAPGNWMNSFYPSGLALGANFVRSDSFGAFPAEHNNGFERGIRSGFPSTDPPRMQAFFAAELAYRGYDEADFVDTPPFGGPLATQLDYQPSACEDGEGVTAGGEIVWSGGPARYLYILEPGGQSPTVPPNLDLPAETMWRLDVPSTEAPMVSGDVRYGEVPSNLAQRFPEVGGPTPLQPGVAYYLYVTRDVGQPITRCLFTF